MHVHVLARLCIRMHAHVHMRAHTHITVSHVPKEKVKLPLPLTKALLILQLSKSMNPHLKPGVKTQERTPLSRGLKEGEEERD